MAKEKLIVKALVNRAHFRPELTYQVSAALNS
jgi:hypothetical protein